MQAHGLVPAAALTLAMLARRIAQAQVDLDRVRRARHDLTARALAHPNDRVSPRVLADLARELGVMEGYERRARSRRKFAIRDFDEARAAVLAKQSQRARPARPASTAGGSAPDMLSDLPQASRSVAPSPGGT